MLTLLPSFRHTHPPPPPPSGNERGRETSVCLSVRPTVHPSISWIGRTLRYHASLFAHLSLARVFWYTLILSAFLSPAFNSADKKAIPHLHPRQRGSRYKTYIIASRDDATLVPHLKCVNVGLFLFPPSFQVRAPYLKLASPLFPKASLFP